jgi:Acetyltransferase (GNAT) domain
MKAAYAQFCTQGYTPLYWQPWWLDATCGPEQWQLRLVTDKGGAPVAAWVAHERRKWGLLPVWTNPPLSSYSGCWFHLPDNPDFKRVTQYAWEKQVMTDLIRQLPARTAIRQTLHPDVQYTLPLHWAGYGLNTRFTYRFGEVPAPAQWLPIIKRKLRTDLLKAQRLVKAQNTDDTAVVFQLHQASLVRKQVQTPYEYTTFERVCQAAKARQQVQMWVANDLQTGETHASLCMVHDERQGYLLLSGTAPQHKHSGAVLLLMQEALFFCHQHGLGLDFEGSMLEPVEMVLRNFGGQLTICQAIKGWHF